MQALRKLAMKFPAAEEGIACAGTVIEKRTIKVRNKAFLFLGANDAMFKVRESMAEVARFAAEDPEHCKVGASGWVTLKLEGSTTPVAVIEKWIGESYRLLVPSGTAGKSEKRKPAKGKSGKRRAARRKPAG